MTLPAPPRLVMVVLVACSVIWLGIVTLNARGKVDMVSPSPVPTPLSTASVFVAPTVETSSLVTATPSPTPWRVHRSRSGSYSFESSPRWQSHESAYGFEFGTILKQYNYSKGDDGYGFVEGRTTLSDYGHGTPGTKTSEEWVTLDGVKALKKVYEGSRFGSTTYPPTRLETYDFTRRGIYYHLEFTSAKKNELLWSEFYGLIKSWRFTE